MLLPLPEEKFRELPNGPSLIVSHLIWMDSGTGVGIRAWGKAWQEKNLKPWSESSWGRPSSTAIQATWICTAQHRIQYLPSFGLERFFFPLGVRWRKLSGNWQHTWKELKIKDYLQGQTSKVGTTQGTARIGVAGWEQERPGESFGCNKELSLLFFVRNTYWYITLDTF